MPIGHRLLIESVCWARISHCTRSLHFAIDCLERAQRTDARTAAALPDTAHDFSHKKAHANGLRAKTRQRLRQAGIYPGPTATARACARSLGPPSRSRTRQVAHALSPTSQTAPVPWAPHTHRHTHTPYGARALTSAAATELPQGF